MQTDESFSTGKLSGPSLVRSTNNENHLRKELAIFDSCFCLGTPYVNRYRELSLVLAFLVAAFTSGDKT